MPNLENLGDVSEEQRTRRETPRRPGSNPRNSTALWLEAQEFNKPLSDVEAIAAFTLMAHPFSQENGELTPTLKLRRKVVQEHYREQIESMYRD